MTLASEIGRVREARLTAVRALQAGVRRDLATGKAALRRTSADHAKTVRADLDGIFSEAAVIRGRTIDMIKAFANEHENDAKSLRAELGGYVSNLQAAVARLLKEHTRTRDEMSVRGTAARADYLKDLRDRLHRLLATGERVTVARPATQAAAKNQKKTTAAKPATESKATTTEAKPATQAAARHQEKTTAAKPAAESMAKATEAKPATQAAARHQKKKATAAKPAAEKYEKTDVAKPGSLGTNPVASSGTIPPKRKD